MQIITLLKTFSFLIYLIWNVHVLEKEKHDAALVDNLFISLTCKEYPLETKLHQS